MILWQFGAATAPDRGRRCNLPHFNLLATMYADGKEGGTLTAARTILNASLFPQRSISYDKPNGTAIRANIINKCGCNFQETIGSNGKSNTQSLRDSPFSFCGTVTFVLPHSVLRARYFGPGPRI